MTQVTTAQQIRVNQSRVGDTASASTTAIVIAQEESIPIINITSLLEELGSRLSLIDTPRRWNIPQEPAGKIAGLLTKGLKVDFSQSDSITALREQAILSTGFSLSDSKVSSLELSADITERRKQNLGLYKSGTAYLEQFNQSLKELSQEYFLYTLSKKLNSENDLTTLTSLTNDVSPDLPSAQSARISVANKILAEIEKNSELKLIIFDEAELQKVLNTDGHPIKALADKNPVRFINAIKTLRQLHFIGSISERSHRLSNNRFPTVLSKYLDELNSCIERNEESSQSSFSTQTERSIVEAINETVKAYRTAVQAEVTEVEKLTGQTVKAPTPASLAVATNVPATPFPAPAGNGISRRAMLGIGGGVGIAVLAGVLLATSGKNEPEPEKSNGPGVANVEGVRGDTPKVDNTTVINDIIRLNQELMPLSKNGKDYGDTEKALVQAGQKNLSTAKGTEIMAGLWNQAGTENETAVNDLKNGLGKVASEKLIDLQTAFTDLIQAHYRAKISTVMEKGKDFGAEYEKAVRTLEKTYMMDGLSDAEDKLAFLATYPPEKLKPFYTERVKLYEEESGFRNLTDDQKTMVTELLEMTPKKYTDKEDTDQVAKAYQDYGSKSGINNSKDATRGKLVELAQKAPEALSGLYVELLDTDCRVQAKTELAELLRKYPIEGVDRDERKENIGRVYLSTLQYYLMPKPSQELLKRDVSESIGYIKTGYPTGKDKWVPILEKFLSGEVSETEFINHLNCYELGSLASKLKYSVTGLVAFSNIERFIRENKFTLPKEIPSNDLGRVKKHIENIYSSIPKDQLDIPTLRTLFTDQQYFDNQVGLYHLFGRDILTFGYTGDSVIANNNLTSVQRTTLQNTEQKLKEKKRELEITDRSLLLAINRCILRITRVGLVSK